MTWTMAPAGVRLKTFLEPTAVTYTLPSAPIASSFGPCIGCPAPSPLASMTAMIAPSGARRSTSFDLNAATKTSPALSATMPHGSSSPCPWPSPVASITCVTVRAATTAPVPSKSASVPIVVTESIPGQRTRSIAPPGKRPGFTARDDNAAVARTSTKTGAACSPARKVEARSTGGQPNIVRCPRTPPGQTNNPDGALLSCRPNPGARAAPAWRNRHAACSVRPKKVVPDRRHRAGDRHRRGRPRGGSRPQRVPLLPDLPGEERGLAGLSGAPAPRRRRVLQRREHTDADPVRRADVRRPAQRAVGRAGHRLPARDLPALSLGYEELHREPRLLRRRDVRPSRHGHLGSVVRRAERGCRLHPGQQGERLQAV